MKIKKYDDRETAPLSWHNFSCRSLMFGGCLLIILAILLAYACFKEGTGGDVQTTAMQSIYVLFTLVFLVIGIVSIMLSSLGRKFKKSYLILKIIIVSFELIATIAVVLSGNMNNSLAFDAFGAAIGTAYDLFYYYQRWDLFASDYDEKHQMKNCEIANDALM